MADWDAIHRELETELGEGITIDALTGGWRIAQRTAGHRHSVDDVLTADWAAREVVPAPGGAGRVAGRVADRVVDRVLDLGTGIGGVGLLVLWRLPAARLVCVEAQAVSHRLLLANLAGNELEARVEPHLGDLREFRSELRFGLVTGSPPYFPLGTGIVPQDSQRAHARFELRGDVGDYARAAARHLAEDGVYVFCFPTPQRTRALDAVTAAGLAVVSYRDVVPRISLRPLFTVFVCRRSAPAPCRIDPPFAVRNEDGTLTAAMAEVRTRSGF